jgi:hypothetical protein
MFDFAIAGVQAPIFLLALVGLTVGIVGGFIGVGGRVHGYACPDRFRVPRLHGLRH